MIVMKKVYCPECGAVNDATSISCYNCGSLLAGAKLVERVKKTKIKVNLSTEVQKFEEGESLLGEFHPSAGLRKYYIRVGAFSTFISLFIPAITSLVEYFFSPGPNSFNNVIYETLVYGATAIPLFLFGALRQINSRFKNTKYLITNKRIILNVWRNGLRVSIIPYQEISSLNVVQPRYFKKHGFASVVVIKKRDSSRILEKLRKTDPLLDPENIKVIKEEEQSLKVKKVRRVKRLKIGENTIADLDETDAHTVITLINQYVQKKEATKERPSSVMANTL
ncbi:MAG: hypothetical protein AAE986_07860 [Thermoplasmataceae archaeon]|nr:hypothetical protein [Candidatus Thermoplasmatota archaeon]